jgi:hypothetical protein
VSACARWAALEAERAARPGEIMPATCACTWRSCCGHSPAEEFLNSTPDEIVARFEQALRPKRYGGSHKNDWRCTDPSCRHRNSIKSFACAKCKRPAPLNGRLTRAALAEREKEHSMLAYLRQQGL